MNPRPSSEFDFFVSYSRADNANGWITRLIDDLLADHRLFARNDPDRELKPLFANDNNGL